jgi:beta-lactam-binding protein with PASTA domain/predicted Ser/Thr protein kinase
MTLVGGRYELGEIIGRGGMADVLHGTDVRLGRDVAVKVLREDLARDPSFQARFRREAQSAASLDAPSVVAVYDTGEDERGVPWIVMEYVDGRTLRDVLTTEGRLLPQRALEVTADVCSALEVAHAAGMVHRDIKPANVMLTSRGEVKVMDFGIARAAANNESTMTQTSAVIGTAAYLSPEQARGEHVDSRSDLYSTGCLLYELVTGAPPFVGDSPVAVAYQHVREDPVPPSEYDPSLSLDVDAVILKAMAKNPANRYQSADEMREDLLRAVAGVPVLATPVLRGADPGTSGTAGIALVRARQPRRSRPFVYSAFSALLVAVATGAFLLVHALLGSNNDLIKPPVVVGLSQLDATQQLSALGLRVDKITTVFNAKAVGTVLAQSPDKNFFVRRGGTIDLTISRGVQVVTVPPILGAMKPQALALLATAKLTVKVETRDGNVEAGTVLDVVPRPGTRLAAKSPVTIIIATGNVQVPDVRNLPQDQAIAILGAAGFGIGLRPVQALNPSIPPGTVIAQTPVLALAPRQSDVILDVVQAPPAPTAPATPAPGPTPAPSPTVTPPP